MDFWVVAAATGAGYIAKYSRNLTSNETQDSSGSYYFYAIHRQSNYRNLLQQIRDQTNPLARLARVQNTDGFFLDGQGLQNSRVTGNGAEKKSNFSDISGQLRSRYYGNYLEPLDSIDSSLGNQLHREYVAVEEYVYKSLHSQMTQTVRPFLLTDGREIISRSSQFSAENDMQSLPRKLKTGIRRHSQRFSMMKESVQPFHSPGFPNAKILFLFGVTFGIMSGILANRSEVKNLNEMLTKTEKLVEDLHEELEMKDMFNIKEIPYEDLESLETNQPHLLNEKLCALYPGHELDGQREGGRKESEDQKAENSVAMSEIEAELVAELERLELNTKQSSFERTSNCAELDPGVIAGLKVDKANGEPDFIYDSDSNVSGTSSNHPDVTNYAVSPQELSLRLHNVIQSRLEARIVELETALENSQKRLRSLKLERSIPPCRDVYGEVKSSSQESQTFVNEDYNNHYSWS